MSCDQLPLVRRMAVDRPKALDTATWKAHLEQCEACRDERHALARSLVVYRHVESQLRDNAPAGPTWEAFAQTLEREQRWQRMRARMRVPVAAASVFVAVGLGAVLWPIGAGLEPMGELAIHHAQPVDGAAPLSGLELRLGEGLLRELGAVTLPAKALTAESMPDTTRSAEASPPASAPHHESAGPTLYVSTRGNGAGDTGPYLRVRKQGQDEPVRAPVLLFRSLKQQQEVRRPAVRVLPVSSPATDLGTQAFAVPRPIR